MVVGVHALIFDTSSGGRYLHGRKSLILGVSLVTGGRAHSENRVAILEGRSDLGVSYHSFPGEAFFG